MICECANPQCGKILSNLRKGRVYLFEMSVVPGISCWRQFWLCSECWGMVKLVQRKSREVVAIRRYPAGMVRARAGNAGTERRAD